MLRGKLPSTANAAGQAPLPGAPVVAPIVAPARQAATTAAAINSSGSSHDALLARGMCRRPCTRSGAGWPRPSGA